MSVFVYDPSSEDEIAQMAEMTAAKIEIAEAIADLMRQNAPVDTGEYRDSIQVFVNGTEVSVGSTDDKAHIIEFGGVSAPTFAVLRRSAEQIMGTENVR